MKKLNTILLPVFLILSIANLAADFAQWQTGIYLTKPLLLTVLSGWFYFQTKDRTTAFSRFMLAGFIFSIGGDTFLMFVKSGGEHFFLLGLGSFLLAHLCYITAFLKYPVPSFVPEKSGTKGEGKQLQFPFVEKGAVLRKPWLAVPLLLFLLVMCGYLWDGLPAAFKVPVVVYSCVITAMAVCCLNMSGRVAPLVFKMLFTGALLFVFSDTLIALDKFKPVGLPDVLTRFLIMSTYLAGQFLLAKGSVMAGNVQPNPGSAEEAVAIKN